MLSNLYFLAKFRFDTAENEPAKSLQNLPILLTLPEKTQPGAGAVIPRISQVELREAAERRKAPASAGGPSEESEVCREVRRLNEVLGKHLSWHETPLNHPN